MDNKDIHKNLPKESIRNLLAPMLGHYYRGEVDNIERKLAQIQYDLKKAKNAEAAMQLIEASGWETFDVSDEIAYNSKTYYPFVGTRQELDALLKALESEG